MTPLAELSASRELMLNLTLRELRGKYKRSVLGWSWSLLNPLATMLMFTVVFRVFLRVPVPRGRPSGMHEFAFFLLCGLLPWNFVANSLSGAMSALLGNANLIKKVYFPREVLVAANVASWAVSLLIELAVLAVALLVAGNMVLPWLPALVLLVVLQAVFVVGAGLALSVLNVYFRDVQHLIGIVLQLWFYATPIVYPLSLVPRTAEVLGHEVPIRFLYGLNPMVPFVEAYRDRLYHLRLPSLGELLSLATIAVVALGVGLVVFARLEPKLAEEL
jgi:ABC-type polysaccharide/polyol phosphate export permease